MSQRSSKFGDVSEWRMVDAKSLSSVLIAKTTLFLGFYIDGRGRSGASNMDVKGNQRRHAAEGIDIVFGQ